MLSTNSDRKTKCRVLAVSSGGGHWLELLRLAPAFDQCEVTYATVSEAYRAQAPSPNFEIVPDATRWNKFGAMIAAWQIFRLLRRTRPHVVISTGALPGYFAVRFGKLLGARTIWLDSFANAEELSLAGRLAGKWADLWLTQWPEVSQLRGPHYSGAVFDVDRQVTTCEHLPRRDAPHSNVGRLPREVATAAGLE